MSPEMRAAIERYEKAKKDGTLDEKFPVIGKLCPCGCGKPLWYL